MGRLFLRPLCGLHAQVTDFLFRRFGRERLQYSEVVSQISDGRHAFIQVYDGQMMRLVIYQHRNAEVVYQHPC